MYQSDEAARINKFLAGFGINQIDPKKPMFRLVWSTLQHEKRLGEFSVYAGPIFLRTEVGVRELPKYPYLADRWILEQWYPPEIAISRELPDSKYGSYEPIYVFEDKNGNALPLLLKVAEIIMHSKFNNHETVNDKMCRLQAEQDLKDEKIQQYVEDMVETSDVMSNLHFGEGIIVPSNYDVESPNLRKNNAGN